MNMKQIFESAEYIPLCVWEEYQIAKMNKTIPNRIITEFEDVSFIPKTRSEDTDAYSPVNYPDQHNEDASAVTTGPYAGQPTVNEDGSSLKDNIASKAGNIKQSAVELKNKIAGNPATQKAIKASKDFAVKVQDFTKSSVAKINALPETTQAKMINENILDAKEEPRSLVTNLKKGLTSAGKGLAVAGLAITSLPLAAAAVVANKKIDIGVKKQAAEELQHELIRLDGQIQAADQAGDYDKKADLLIAKRTAQQAHAKLKYGLKSKLTRVND
jgi:hypothetical protein